MLALAAHWADLHNGDALDRTGAVLPGMERAKQLGGPGTPRVAEFCTAEFGAVQDLGYISADNYLRDALNLRHRHPGLWAAIFAGQARVWQAREVAKLVQAADLSLAQALGVDAQTSHRLGSLPWGRFLHLVEAKIIEADPDAAEARRVAAAMDRFVRTGQCNEYGLKTIIVKAEAGDAIFFVAMCDRIAQILALRGDTDPVDVRRSKAVGIPANPARALVLLQQCAAVADPAAGDGHVDHRKEDGSPEDMSGDGESVGEGDVHPSVNDADDPDPQANPCPTCDADDPSVMSGDPSAFVRSMKVDPSKLLPPATLHVHVSEDSFTRDKTGVARVEGVGPVTIDQAVDFLGHTNVSVKPVIDIANQKPVDGYEVPDQMRDVIHLRTPADVFPFGINLSRNKDMDHPVPFLALDDGGPPGQTNMGNLGPLTRFPHRLKTHGRWRLRQPEPGIYLWRSPHGWIFLVDHNGTHNLGNSATAQAMWDRASGDAGQKPDKTVELIAADDILQYESAQVA